MNVEDKNTILTILNSDGNKFSVELSWDVGIDELLNSFYGMLVASTYHPQAILRGMKEFVEDHEDILNKNEE